MNFKINESEQKLRGGYYTPKDIAYFITDWVCEREDCRTVLEPSCGDGVFFEAVENYSPLVALTGFEIDGKEAGKSIERCRKLNLNYEIYAKDFLSWSILNIDRAPLFDGVIGNPPFVRYQYLDESFQRDSEWLFAHNHIPFTRHTNLWVPFVIASINLLRAGGRLGMIVPSELLHVLHSKPLRSFLYDQCSEIVIIDPQDIWFENTLQGAVILFAQKKITLIGPSNGLAIIPTSGRSFLKQRATNLIAEANFVTGDILQEKWTYALLSPNELALLNAIKCFPQIHQFKEIAKVDVGVVTGANDYFLVSDETKNRYNLHRWSHPMFGRSDHCRGIIYDELQHNENIKRGLPANFLWFNSEIPNDAPEAAKAYIRLGEERKLHQRYKCRIRTPWYKVPSVYSTPIGMLKRAHDIPRLIYNEIGALTTDTAYRISPINNIPPQNIVCNFINSLTALSAELEGRSYGGGVLELVPSEIEKLLYISSPLNHNIRELHNRVLAMEAENLLQDQDRLVLTNLGLNQNDICLLHNAWFKLKQRRQRKFTQE